MKEENGKENQSKTIIIVHLEECKMLTMYRFLLLLIPKIKHKKIKLTSFLKMLPKQELKILRKEEVDYFHFLKN